MPYAIKKNAIRLSGNKEKVAESAESKFGYLLSASFALLQVLTEGKKKLKADNQTFIWRGYFRDILLK